MAGAGAGIGTVFGSLVLGIARNPSLVNLLFRYAILGLPDAIAFGLMMAFLILFAFLFVFFAFYSHKNTVCLKKIFIFFYFYLSAWFMSIIFLV